MTKEEKIKEAIKTIVEYNRDSAYVQHFKVEYGEPQDEGFSKLMYDDMIELLSLLSLQGDSCNSIGTKLILFKKAASFEILSPLKFTDDEWNELAYGKPNEYQNNDGRIDIILEYNGKRISYNKCFIQVNPSMPTMNGHEEVLPDGCFEIKIVCDYKIMI